MEAVTDGRTESGFIENGECLELGRDGEIEGWKVAWGDTHIDRSQG